jgi:hypothetical protein
MGVAPFPSEEQKIAQQDLNTLVYVRSGLPLASSIGAVIVARRMYGLKFWGSVGVWIVAGIVVASLVAIATQKPWNDAIARGAVSPLDNNQ